MFFEAKAKSFWSEKILDRVDVALYVQPKNSLRSRLRAIMVLITVDKVWKTNSRETNQVEFFAFDKFTNSCQEIWVRANQSFIFFFFYTPHLRRKSTMRRCFYHTDLVQNVVFHNFSRQIAFIQYSGPSKHAWTFNQRNCSKNFQNHL